MNKYLMIGLVLLVGCSDDHTERNKQDKITAANYMECTGDLTIHNAHTMYRCENTEILCYVSSTGQTCKFKTP